MIEEPQEQVDEHRVPLRALPLAKPADRFVARNARAVRTVGDHRVPCVGDRDQARAEGNRGARETVRITLTIEALVVVANDRKVVRGAAEWRADSFAFDGVPPHRRRLALVERARFQQDGLGHRDLPDVMEHAALVEDVEIFAIQPVRATHLS